jgi:hypothetical protein
MVEVLLDAHRGTSSGSASLETNDHAETAKTDPAPVDTPRLKRYFNE